MSLVSTPGPLVGRDEFERMQASAGEGLRLERMDGYVYAMAGAGLTHERMVARLIVALSSAARSTGCEVLGSNRRLAIGDGSDFLPDVSVYCDPSDNDGYAGLRPCLMIEVLSRSTAIDAILFVNPSPLYAELFTRSGNDWQQRHVTEPADTIELPYPPMVIRLSDLA